MATVSFSPPLLDQQIYGEDLTILSKEPDRIVYRLNGSGAAGEETRITAYQVFPGIQLVYRDIHSPSCTICQHCTRPLLEISHCREGRLEYESGDSFCYVMPGDMAILHRHDATYSTHFPLHHYHGISVLMDLTEVPRCLSCFLEDVTVSPHDIADKFCRERPFFVCRSSSGIEHIFSELYQVPAAQQKGYCKVKVLELMLYLAAFSPAVDETSQKSCSRSQVELAKQVCAYLTEHISDRITLEQLSSIFHMSGTSIKNSFRLVYGESVYNYIRTRKMQMAADLLRSTDATVLEIAGRFGYDNASKFSSAFKDVHGVTPQVFRTGTPR